MPEPLRVVFGQRDANDRLPDWANTGVVIIEWLRQQGLWAEATQRLKIQREGGYAGIDALMFLTYFFGSGLPVGIKEFSDRARQHHRQLAAVGERHWLPTQASMSRILSAVEAASATEFGAWLLLQAPGVAAVLQHPSVVTRDAVGEAWHVFDWDPTVTTLRHRALPVFEGMPDGRRRSRALAAPGYPGRRKRGEVQFSRATLQHAGSGLWLGIEMGPGNGALRDTFQSAIRQVVATCEHAGLLLARAILRADGAAGTVPFITACMQTGVHFVTRLAHYQLLKDQNVVRHLNEATWFEVPSSGSGPRRQATDLGRVMLEPSSSSLQADGSAFAPVEVRVVVSRFPCAEEGHGAGVTLQGWNYELYGTDLCAAAWPAVEIVTSYYGRNGQENRFGQEDRELGLDRILSYNLPGQQLATLVGLFVWNFQICRGFDLSRPTDGLPLQRRAQNEPLTETPRLPEAEATQSSATADEVGIHAGRTQGLVEMRAETSLNAAPMNALDGAAHDGVSVTKHPVLELLHTVDWKHALKRHENWSWRPDPGGLQCPAAAVLPFIRVEQVKDQPIRARFQADWGTCDACELRGTCIRSVDPSYRKDMRIPIPPPLDQVLRQMWLRFAGEPRPPQTVQKDAASRMSQQEKGLQVAAAPTRSIWRLKQLPWRPPELPQDRPKLIVAPPILLPAELRKVLRSMTRQLEVHVAVDSPSAVPKPCPVLAPSVAQRQKRRLTWDERLGWNQIPAGTSIEIRLLGAHLVRQLLGAVTKLTMSA